MPIDVLSSVLHDLRVEGSVFCRFEGGGPWAVAYPESTAAAFHLVTSGVCALRVLGRDGLAADTYLLGAGDFAVLPHGTSHVLVAVDPPDVPRANARHVSVTEAVEGRDVDGIVRLGRARGGHVEAAYVCGSFRFAHRRPHPVIAALPTVLVVRRADADADGRDADGSLGPWLAVHLAAATCEAAAGRPGADVVLARLSDVLFVHAIRAHLASAPAGAPGWTGALRDPAVARALALLHAEPERAWTVASLASEVAMSRSRFAARFAALVGQPPLGYLADWRMRRAERWLAEERASVGEVAARLGYRSEAAFSHAFRRRLGASPGAVRRAGSRLSTASPAGTFRP